jgi:hypothetical protein
VNRLEGSWDVLGGCEGELTADERAQACSDEEGYMASDS